MSVDEWEWIREEESSEGGLAVHKQEKVPLFTLQAWEAGLGEHTQSNKGIVQIGEQLSKDSRALSMDRSSSS